MPPSIEFALPDFVVADLQIGSFFFQLSTLNFLTLNFFPRHCT